MKLLDHTLILHFKPLGWALSLVKINMMIKVVCNRVLWTAILLVDILCDLHYNNATKIYNALISHQKATGGAL